MRHVDTPGTRTGARAVKVLRVIARLNVGGPAIHVINLTRGLDATRFDTTLVTGTENPGEGSMLDFALEQGVKPVVIPEIVGQATPRGPWPASLLAPYLERRVRELLPGTSVTVALVESGRRGREKRSDAAIGMALGRRVTVRRQPDGKPTVDGEHVSAAHSGRLTFAVTGSGPVGCDVEPIAHRDEPGWCALVGTEGWSLAAHVAGTVGEAIDASATRVWSAMECARKAGAAPGPFRLGPCTSDGWVVLEAEGIAAATTVSRVQGSEDPLLFAVLVSPGLQHASL